MPLATALLAALALALPVSAAEQVVGLSAHGTLIQAQIVPARAGSTSTVLLLGGLHGEGASSAEVRTAVARYLARPPSARAFRLIAIATANPEGAALEFPPTGIAYREHTESNLLWRWIGIHAPDRVLITDADDSGFAAALEQQPVAGVGAIPARRGVTAAQVLEEKPPPPSDAHRELERRLARSPLELARELAMYYGHDFSAPIYINALALLGQLRLGHLDAVRALAEPYVDGTRDSLARANSLVIGGHLIFGELARRTGDARYLARVRAAAALGFEPDGSLKRAMPFNAGFSDSIFMDTIVLAQAGALTGERRYFDMAARHVAYMRGLLLRPDGLYRHEPGNDAAWGRGNGFPALGLALLLADFPKDHPEYPTLLRDYREHMRALLPHQDADGLWHNVIDVPGSYAEFSATALIGFAMRRGIEAGWLDEPQFGPAVRRAWQAVLGRVGAQGQVFDVSESTIRADSPEFYLHRAAILGADPRGGAVALLFATEMAGLR